MAKQSNLLITPLILLIITISTNSTLTTSSSPPTLTHLHFYFHDTITAPPTRSAYELNLETVAKINSTTAFGLLVMADDPLTSGPELNSTRVGSAQGMFGSASLTEYAFLMMMNFAFTAEGEYNGSTLSLYGRNAVFEDVREMAIVGGTGVFRFAKGYAEARTYSIDAETGPELNSTLVGRAQGMYGSAALTGQTAYFMVFNFVFVAGEYEGSTISLYGRNAIFDDVREMPVVGGTGVFRFARGYAEARTYKVDTVKFNVVVEYDVYVSHYF
ncbi:Dirigent protein 2 [Linum grandiflorum]